MACRQWEAHGRFRCQNSSAGYCCVMAGPSDRAHGPHKGMLVPSIHNWRCWYDKSRGWPSQALRDAHISETAMKSHEIKCLLDGCERFLIIMARLVRATCTRTCRDRWSGLVV